MLVYLVITFFTVPNGGILKCAKHFAKTNNARFWCICDKSSICHILDTNRFWLQLQNQTSRNRRKMGSFCFFSSEGVGERSSKSVAAGAEEASKGRAVFGQSSVETLETMFCWFLRSKFKVTKQHFIRLERLETVSNPSQILVFNFLYSRFACNTALSQTPGILGLSVFGLLATCLRQQTVEDARGGGWKDGMMEGWGVRFRVKNWTVLNFAAVWTWVLSNFFVLFLLFLVCMICMLFVLSFLSVSAPGQGILLPDYALQPDVDALGMCFYEFTMIYVFFSVFFQAGHSTRRFDSAGI